MDEIEFFQNLVVFFSFQNEVLFQFDLVFLEVLSFWYLGDFGLDDFFLDIDIFVVEKEFVWVLLEFFYNFFCVLGFWEWNELDYIMEIILGF